MKVYLAPWEQRWLDEARRTKRCPECAAPLVDRSGSSYCSIACADMAYRREIEPRERAKS